MNPTSRAARPVRQPNVSAWRWGVWAATIATVIPLTVVMARSLTDDRPVLSLAVLGLFVVLTTWIALWFWIASTGFVLAWRRSRATAPAAAAKARPRLLSPTAILVPIYNEDPREVFARVRAMLKSLERTGRAGSFDFFLLSDTTNPDVWLEEQWHWLELQRELKRPMAVYYRRRSRNAHRKAGNIKDFCERWGALYPLMVVLDADSLMEGATLVELVRRMDEDPQLGLLQTPTLPLGDRSLLSRCQQFAARLCGGLLACGLDWYSGDGGNYWGHNAILRTEAFTRHCGLSDLPGRAPLGGEILSHDFVEAALMQRAGYKVRLACDLTASYEQCPGTLPSYAQRENRWCQGNLQHARLIVSRGMPLSNRFHFLTGVLAYVSAPLWLAFMALSVWTWLAVDPTVLPPHDGAGPSPGALSLAVFGVVMAMLVAPRLYGALVAARAPGGLRGFGGALRLAGSLLLEFSLSVILAPIMMAFHTLFVFSTLTGRRVEWNAQMRTESGVSLRHAWRVHRRQTVAGVLATAALAIWLPESLPWLSPVLLGLVLSIPISMAISSARFGDWFKRRRWLAIPEELSRPAVVQEFARELARGEERPTPQRADMFRRLLNDPVFLRSHLDGLRATAQACEAPRQMVRDVATQLASNRWENVPAEEKRTVLLDPSALMLLHRFLWRRRGSRAETPVRAPVGAP